MFIHIQRFSMFVCLFVCLFVLVFFICFLYLLWSGLWVVAHVAGQVVILPIHLQSINMNSFGWFLWWNFFLKKEDFTKKMFVAWILVFNCLCFTGSLDNDYSNGRIPNFLELFSVDSWCNSNVGYNEDTLRHKILSGCHDIAIFFQRHACRHNFNFLSFLLLFSTVKEVIQKKIGKSSQADRLGWPPSPEAVR